MYKLVAFDLDGTLLNDEKNISVNNLKLIHMLMDKGVEVVISTGRGYNSCQYLVNDIKDDIICICNNGAIARTLHSKKEIFTSYMDKKEVLKILEIGYKNKTTPLIHVNGYENGVDVLYRYDNLQFKPDNRNKKSSLRYRELKEFNSENLNNILALAYFDSEQVTKKLYKDTKKIDTSGFKFHFMENTSGGNSLVEYMNKDVDKWNGIYKYAKSKNIKSDEIVVIGDDNNDYGMIKNAGMGIAMGNATEKVKKVADIILEGDNNSSSIYNILYKLFLRSD